MSTNDDFWEDIESAMDIRHAEGSNVRIAMTLYNAGGGTVESLIEDWALTDDEAAELLKNVRQAWSEGRWKDRRSSSGRREND